MHKKLKYFIVITLIALICIPCGFLFWYKLPYWAPHVVMEWSPFLDQKLRACSRMFAGKLNFETDNPDTVAHIISMSRDADPQLRASMALLLRTVSHHHPNAEARLKELQFDSNEFVREVALDTGR